MGTPSHGLTRLMATPGCSTATLLRFALGVSFRSLRWPHPHVHRCGQTVWKPTNPLSKGIVVLSCPPGICPPLSHLWTQSRSAGRTDGVHGFLAKRRCNNQSSQISSRAHRRPGVVLPASILLLLKCRAVVTNKWSHRDPGS